VSVWPARTRLAVPAVVVARTGHRDHRFRCRTLRRQGVDYKTDFADYLSEEEKNDRNG